ncbi:MAG: hypothetical protein JSW00_17060 [Thermoplasmata archaeon]|nr:MAG: hypothetical protein JSW00_17060 [Thermoplasmata archaeon]
MKMDLDIWNFLTIILLVFALCTLIAGIFTAYFGAGKSRKIGAGLIVLGLLIGVMWVYLAGMSNVIPGGDENIIVADVIILSIYVIIATIIGIVMALGLFLGAIMKS